MLVLSRKPNESIVIAGGIVITVLGVQGRRVKLGIEAPADVGIARGEFVAASPSAPATKNRPGHHHEAWPVHPCTPATA